LGVRFASCVMSSVRVRVLWLVAALVAAGCAREPGADDPRAAAPARRKTVLQTDWFPQAEHGGFYQALARGFYEQAGLEVEIRSGGPGVGIKVPVSTGEVDFGMNRSDDVMVVASRGLPLVMVAAVLQHDPQALMVHADSPVKSFKDLKGRAVTASVGMTWIPYIQKKHRLSFDLKPNTYGVAAFLADPEAIQQCFVTNEPFFVQQQGVRVRTLPLAESGFDVYHTIICRRDLVRQSPELVRVFVAASIRGWRDYLDGNPEPAHALIMARNRHTTREQLDFSRGELILRSLVTGDRARGEDIGQLSLARLAAERDVLLELKVMEVPVAIGAVATREFLPPAPP
jgi:NitT/TauT family transport system substrate-binding protein